MADSDGQVETSRRDRNGSAPSGAPGADGSAAGRPARGRLRIYLGSAAGVGKTYAMLNEGHRRVERGADVVVGFAEAHARPHTIALLDGLEVDVTRMRANVDITNGVALAESVSMVLAAHIGKFDAHRTIGAASRRAIAEDRALADVLAEMPEVTKHLSKEEITRMLTPENYLGASVQLVRAAVATHAGERDGAARARPK